MSRQLVESLGPGLSRVWDVSEVLFDEHTGYQQVLIGRTAQGVSLFCDDERQSTEASQLVYHEALMVPAMLLADAVRRVLIIGSSEGVASRLAVEFGASLVDHVDLDRVVVRACAELLPYGYTVEELEAAERGEGPVRMHYADGFSFVDASEGGYDVVVIDLPDENTDAGAQHNRLYGADFLRRCAALLAPGGVVSCQGGCPTLWRNDTLRTAWARFTEVFATPVYFGSDEHEWAFLSGRVDQVADPVGAMISRLGGFTPATLDAETLRGSTVVPFSLRARR
ncbi:spermidine synthase [Amycolatopsis viridis]|uniref:Polyamine aminopropyltransferase n=1 Tax=Amycolatopsis viridis TaxID=185678 RepID=A0ABX0SSI5_9PSEU|nr:spermidine synthase [Amycolatopsis viridis]NIH79513.1 spermidine synthase [Amycolatopsis viridis]